MNSCDGVDGYDSVDSWEVDGNVGTWEHGNMATWKRGNVETLEIFGFRILIWTGLNFGTPRILFCLILAHPVTCAKINKAC